MDSQVMGSLDSMSPPSEPPDIRNWFSSYVYESPELNTLDGFRDIDASAETILDEEVKAKLVENGNIGKQESGAGAEGQDDVVVECNKSAEIEHIKPAAVVSGLSESLSLCSEPPDIKNWFSSYFYESPPLDTAEALIICDYKENEEERLYNDQRTGIENDTEVKNFTESMVLPRQERLPTVVLKCTNSDKYKLDSHSICKDGQNLELKPNSSTLPQKTSEKVPEQLLPKLTTQNQKHGSPQKFGNTDQRSEDYDAKLRCEFIERSHRPLNIENDSGSPCGKPLYKLNERKDCVENGSENENLHENISPGTLDFVVLEGNSRRRPTPTGIGKENVDNEVSENGFISTRKNNRQKNIENIGASSGVGLDSLRNGGNPEVECAKDRKIRRKVLSETTNFHNFNVVESTGKWRCPQKYKPNLGPPLKQLRLEQWVRRV